MKKLLLALTVLTLGLSAQADEGDIIDVKEYDVYKSSLEISNTAENVRIHDFKKGKAISKRIRYWGMCHVGGDRLTEIKYNEEPCIKTRYERVEVAKVKIRFDVEQMVCRGGGDHLDKDCQMEMVTFRKKFNVKLADLDADTMEILNNRRVLFPKREKYRALANGLYKLDVSPSRGKQEVKISMR